MSYTALATVAIALALGAVAVAAAVAVLVSLRRRRWAQRGIGAMCTLLILAGGCGFLAAMDSDHDLQSQSGHVLALAGAAERLEHERTGRFTTSIVSLSRLDPTLADDITDEDAFVSATTHRVSRVILLNVSLGYGSEARRTERWTRSPT